MPNVQMNHESILLEGGSEAYEEKLRIQINFSGI